MENDNENTKIDEEEKEKIKEILNKQTKLTKEERIILWGELGFNYRGGWLNTTLEDLFIYYPINLIKKLACLLSTYPKGKKKKKRNKKKKFILWISLVILFYLLVGLIVYFFNYFDLITIISKQMSFFRQPTSSEQMTSSKQPTFSEQINQNQNVNNNVNSEQTEVAEKKDVKKTNSSDLLKKALELENNKEYGEAVKYYKLAVEHGSMSARIKLALIGLLYYEGKEVKYNLNEADNCFKYSGFQDDLEKQKILSTLATMLFYWERIRDNKVEKDYVMADNLYGLVEMSHGEKEKEKSLIKALMYYIGDDLVNRNTENFFEPSYDIFKILLILGNSESKKLVYGLGCGLMAGKGIKANLSEAIKFIELSARFGNDEARKMLFGIGCCFLEGYNKDGLIIEKNIPEAVKYIKLAASYGNKEAKDALNNLKKDGLIQEEIQEEIQKEIQNNISCEVNENKIVIALQGNSDQKALGAAKVVQDFYADYLNKNVDLRISWATNKYLTPKTRQIFSLLSFFIDDCDYIINITDGQDFGNLWKINRVDVADDTAVVNLENSWDGNDARSLKIKCKYINTKWFIEDIDAVTNRFYSFLNFNQNLAVVTKNELIISSNKHSSLRTPFFYRKNRIIPLKYFDFSKNNYYIDFSKYNFKIDFNADGSNNLSDLIDSSLIDYDWTVKAEDIIPFNFFNKIRKGESKYLAYIVLGEPSEDSSNKLFYSPDDYISYDKDGKITSWNGFEDLKEFFDDNTGLNNQNIGLVNAKSGINLRKEPNTKSEKVCGLSYDTQVMILDYNGPKATFENITSNWYLITDGTRVGWAFGGLIRAN